MKTVQVILLSFSLLFPSVSFAQGGDDPVPGIDVIIKRDPSDFPIANFSLTPKEMEYQNRKMSFNNRRAYLIKRMLLRLNKINAKNKWKVDWHKVLYKGLNTVWCPPKECYKTVLILKLKVPKEPNTNNVKFKLNTRKINLKDKKVFLKHKFKHMQKVEKSIK